MSLDRQKPSEFSIQAVEPSAIAVLDKSVQDELFARLPQLERYFRLVLQRAYAAAIMRVKYIFTESGEERFRNFNNSFPEFIQRIPQYMLASYLGFTPEFLSKIRAKKN
jgi:CRP-like cAMP-binding protein